MSSFFLGELMQLAIMPMMFAVPGVPLGVPQEADPLLARVAAEECVFYIASYGADPANPGSENKTEQLFAEPEVRRMVKMIEGALTAQSAGDVDGELSKAAAELQTAILTSQMAICVEKLSMGPYEDPEFTGYMIVAAGANSPKLAQALTVLIQGNTDKPVFETIARETFAKLTLGDDSPPLYVGSKGKYLLVGLGEGSIASLFHNAGTAEPAWLTEAKKTVAVDRTAVFAHFNMQKFLADNKESLPPEFHANLKTSGLASTQGVSFASGLGKTRYESNLVVNTDGKLEGVYKLFDVEPLTAADLASVPVDSPGFQAMKIDLSKGEETLLKLVGLNMGISEEEAKEKINSEMEALGLNLSDTLALLKGTLLWSQPKEAGVLSFDWSASLDSPDSQRLSDIVSSMIASSIGGGGGFNGPNPGVEEEDFGFMMPRPEMIEKKYRDSNYRIFKLGGFVGMPFTPSWGVVDGRFVFAYTSQGLRTAIREAKPEKSVATDPLIASALKDEAIAVYRYDPKPMLPLMMMGAQALVDFAGSADLELPAGLDPTIIPPPRTYLKYAEPTVASIRRHEKGLALHMEESYPLISSPQSLPLLVSLGLAYARDAREAAQKTQSMNNLRQIALAVHNYADTHGHLPGNIVDDAGKPLLSWRVQLLPYLEQEALYDSFKLDEPWDSEHNKKLLAKMPSLYASPGLSAKDFKTHYLAIKADSGVLITPKKPGEGVRFAKITDGTSNTVLAMETVSSVEWSKPDDFVPDADDPSKNLFGLRKGAALIAFADGHVVAALEGTPAVTLRGIFTRDGGEPVDTWSLEYPGAYEYYDDPAATSPEFEGDAEGFKDPGFGLEEFDSERATEELVPDEAPLEPSIVP